MKAIVQDRYGSAKVLESRDIEKPQGRSREHHGARVRDERGSAGKPSFLLTTSPPEEIGR